MKAGNDTYADADAYSNPDTYADAYPNADPDADPNADPDAYSDTDTYPDAHADAYSDTDTYPDAHADTSAESDSHAQTLCLGKRFARLRRHGLAGHLRPGGHRHFRRRHFADPVPSVPPQKTTVSKK